MTSLRLLLCALPVLVLAPRPWSTAQEAATPCAKLSEREAEVLIYFLPVAEQLRSQQMDIGWERTPKAEEGSRYVFWVYNSRRSGTGSVTIGYFNVDKCTGVVTEESNTVTSTTLHAVQNILTRRS